MYLTNRYDVLLSKFDEFISETQCLVDGYSENVRRKPEAPDRSLEQEEADDAGASASTVECGGLAISGCVRACVSVPVYAFLPSLLQTNRTPARLTIARPAAAGASLLWLGTAPIAPRSLPNLAQIIPNIHEACELAHTC